jgi:hypothetical protein
LDKSAAVIEINDYLDEDNLYNSCPNNPVPAPASSILMLEEKE